MADWVLIPCLVRLRDEFNTIAPDRAKGADGSVGDLAHQERTSDHNPDETGSVPIHDADHVNEVHALDITTDLREPGLTLEQVVQFLLARCRSGAEKRLRYIIFNRRIWRADNGWRQEGYTGTADPHTGHAHFSGSYDSKLEASTASWHLEDLVALSLDDKKWIASLLDGPAGDVVPRWSDAGGAVAKDDPNPTMTPASAMYYQGAMTKRVENLAVAILAAVGQVDEQVLAGLRDAGQDIDTLATVIVGALGTEKATALGRRLAG